MWTIFGVTQGALIDTAALAAVALVGYLFGRRTRSYANGVDSELLAELSRAASIADQLSQLTQRIRRDVAGYQRNVDSFERTLRGCQVDDEDAGWRELAAQAEALLAPTIKMATDLSHSYEQLRKQSEFLMTFAGSRIDQTTGVHNRRAMQEQLDVHFAMGAQQGERFAIALFSLVSHGDEAIAENHPVLKKLAKVIQNCARDTDFVARYSNDEFAVLMPKTSLAGAVVFSDRLVRLASDELDCPLWGGIVSAVADDDPQRMLSRADSALYSARTCGEPCLFQHTGQVIRRCQSGKPAEPTTPAVPHDADQTAEISLPARPETAPLQGDGGRQGPPTTIADDASDFSETARLSEESPQNAAASTEAR
ncbi:MAG: GGDEF domain-containing protein [Planctomycetales bacterium]|nr:GGDEF domain-containing protein [Planctomycetales bacterium]